MAPTATQEKKEEDQSPNIQLPNHPRLPRGLRKHIRREKARIRREFGNSEETKEKIGELYAKFLKT